MEKSPVVIGGAGGLGEACVKALATQGAGVAVASRGVEKLKTVARTIQDETGSKVVAMQVDVTSEESVNKLAEQVIKDFSTVDILVNAQGINVKTAFRRHQLHELGFPLRHECQGCYDALQDFRQDYDRKKRR